MVVSAVYTQGRTIDATVIKVNCFGSDNGNSTWYSLKRTTKWMDIAKAIISNRATKLDDTTVIRQSTQPRKPNINTMVSTHEVTGKMIQRTALKIIASKTTMNSKTPKPKTWMSNVFESFQIIESLYDSSRNRTWKQIWKATMQHLPTDLSNYCRTQRSCHQGACWFKVEMWTMWQNI